MSDQIRQLINNQLMALSKIKRSSDLLKTMHDSAIQELMDELKKSNPIVLDDEYFEKIYRINQFPGLVCIFIAYIFHYVISWFFVKVFLYPIAINSHFVYNIVSEFP